MSKSSTRPQVRRASRVENLLPLVGESAAAWRRRWGIILARLWVGKDITLSGAGDDDVLTALDALAGVGDRLGRRLATLHAQQPELAGDPRLAEVWRELREAGFLPWPDGQTAGPQVTEVAP